MIELFQDFSLSVAIAVKIELMFAGIVKRCYRNNHSCVIELIRVSFNFKLFIHLLRVNFLDLFYVIYSTGI